MLKDQTVKMTRTLLSLISSTVVPNFATLIAWYNPGIPGSPENVSCSRATPDLHRCNLGVALEQETFLVSQF